MAAKASRGGLTAPVATTRAELCLDFANTLCWRGSDPPSEALRTLDDLLAWCDGAMQSSPAIDRLAGWWRPDTARARAAFAEAIELREGIYRIFAALATSGEPATGDLDSLSRALAMAPARMRLARS